MGESLLRRALNRTGGVSHLLASVPAHLRPTFRYTWNVFARPEQIAPIGNWRTWLVLAGRGFGKTRTGAEWIRAEVEAGRARNIALVAPTAADARDVMVEGPSGILAVSPPTARPHYEPSKRRLIWPNGARASVYSADEPARLRGPQHDTAWADELAAWAYPESWDMLQFGMRMGNPRVIVTTTPRPTAIVKDLLRDKNTAVTKGSTYDNAENLAPQFLEVLKKKYEGTRLGRQEIHAEILDDNPNALWKMAWIDDKRIKFAPALKRICVAIDPAVTSDEDSDETGIAIGGVADCNCRGTKELHGFLLEDRSGIYTPKGWADAGIAGYHHHKADRILAEVNNGGDLVEANLRANGGANLPYKKVHAAKAKQIRAEPVSALSEQGKIHHVGPAFAKMEDQLTQWDPMIDDSPDRLDAYVILFTELMVTAGAPAFIQAPPGMWKPRA